MNEKLPDAPAAATPAPPASPWYRAAVAEAAIAAAFVLLTAAVMTWSHLRLRELNPLDAPAVAELKKQVRQDPGSHDPRREVRLLDQRLREGFFRHQARLEGGGWLLLAFVGSFLMSVSAASMYRKRSPRVSPAPDAYARQAAASAAARWAVVAGAVAVAGTAGLWFFFGPAAGVFTLDEQTAASTKPGTGPTTTSTTAAAPPVARWPKPEEVARNWPRFRGPGGSGVSAYDNAPVEWDGPSGKGVIWKTPLPLGGYSSPVVWGDRVFLTAADKKKREVLCFDAATGRLLWSRPVNTAVGAGAPAPAVYEPGVFAAATGTTDGQRFYAVFANGDLAALDFEGKEVWNDNVGPLDNSYGHTSSLTMFEELLLVQLDQGGGGEDGASRALGIDGRTGRTVWETNRPVGASWSSPIVIAAPAGPQFVACGNPFVIAHDPRTGAETWRANVLGDDHAPSSIFAAGLVIAVSSHSEIAAIRPGGKGDVTKTHVAWKANDVVPDITSPVCDGKRVYVAAGETLACYSLADGRKLWQADTGAPGFESSPSVAGGRVYACGPDGTMIICQAGDEFKEVARCRLGEDVKASPAFLDGRIIIRGVKNLYCVGQRR